MNVSKVWLLSKPQLREPMFVLGLTDPSGINAVVAQTLIEHVRAEKFAEVYSPYFPDCVVSEETGLCHLPMYDLYASGLFSPNVVVLGGDIIPDPGDTLAYYELLSVVVDFAREVGCARFLSFGTYRAEGAEDRVRVAATSGYLASRVAQKLGGELFTRGRIDGLAGMLLGVARLRRLPAVCVLAPFGASTNPADATQAIYHHVLDVLALG